jgi:hypothetical protein
MTLTSVARHDAVNFNAKQSRNFDVLSGAFRERLTDGLNSCSKLPPWR